MQVDRGSGKRKIKPTANQEPLELYDFVLDGGSSSDSDFRVEDHCESSSDESSCFSVDDGRQITAAGDENEIDSMDTAAADCTSAAQHFEHNCSEQVNIPAIVVEMYTCSICLGDEQTSRDDFACCKECGVLVHKGCYGVKNNSATAGSSAVGATVSAADKWWLCDVCTEGIKHPACELCPNRGGAFKKTVNGKWIHLVCAIYIPSVQFGELHQIELTLPDFPPPSSVNKWCVFCNDKNDKFIGVTIKCDVQMCRSNFHVTCAQREGTLSDPSKLESDDENPFFAHCKLHADKQETSIKKRNWKILELRTKIVRAQDTSLETDYNTNTLGTSDPSDVCEALKLNDLMDVNKFSRELTKNQIKALRDIPKTWHVTPALSLEFLAYFHDRVLRLEDLKAQNVHFTDKINELYKKHVATLGKYNQAIEANEIHKKTFLKTEKIYLAYYDIIHLSNAHDRKTHVETDALAEEGSSCPSTDINVDIELLAKFKNSRAMDDDDDFQQLRKTKAPRHSADICETCKTTGTSSDMTQCSYCGKQYHFGCIDSPLEASVKS